MALFFLKSRSKKAVPHSFFVFLVFLETLLGKTQKANIVS